MDDIPREALRGLPNSAVRLISNLCREVFEVNRRMETVEVSCWAHAALDHA